MSVATVEQRSSVNDMLRDMREPVAPFMTGYAAPTFLDNRFHTEAILDADSKARASRIRQLVDPDGLFRGDIVPAALPDEQPH